MKTITLLCCFLMIIVNIEGGGKYKSLKISSEKFSADLFKNLENNTKNQLISPMSIQTIMALLQAGSKGKCLNELSNVLYLPKNKKILTKTFKEYIKNLNDSSIDVKIANNIYVAKGLKLPAQYQKFAKFFNADIKDIDTTNQDATIKEINKWIEIQTNNKIKDIVDDNIINSNTVLVLVNALYFNANWKYPFDEEMTMSRTFYANGKDETKTNMMIEMGNFNYTESKTLNAKILELPYEDEDFVMTIVLPNERNGLSSLTQEIGTIFDEHDFQEEEVTVSLPKFTIEDEVEFNDILKKLGLNSIFKEMEFKGNFYKRKLNVTKIVQKTFIDVNEKGSEAASATAVGIEDRMGGDYRKYFTADHPFVFYIRQKSTGVVLFIGNYKKP